MIPNVMETGGKRVYCSWHVFEERMDSWERLVHHVFEQRIDFWERMVHHVYSKPLPHICGVRYNFEHYHKTIQKKKEKGKIYLLEIKSVIVIEIGQ